jgi:hypothetical protein
VKWLDTIVTINTTNVVKGTFEVLYPKKGDEEYDKSKKQFLAKLYKVQAACRRYQGCHEDNRGQTDGQSDDGRWVVRDLDAL